MPIDRNAEWLIGVTVVGIVAALVLPALNSFGLHPVISIIAAICAGIAMLEVIARIEG